MWDLVHVSRVTNIPLPVPFAEACSNLLQILIIKLALMVQHCVHSGTGRVVSFLSFAALGNELI